MDDLLDLDWKQPSQPPSTAAQTRYIPPSSSSPNYYASPTLSPQAARPSNNTAAKPADNADAFASLFAPSSSKQQANLSLAEAQKRAQQRAQDDKRRNDALWSGIDAASWNSSAPSPALTPVSVSRTSSPAIQPSKPAPQAAKPAPSADPWDLDAFATSLPQAKASSSNGVKSPQKPAVSSSDPFDFAAFEDTPPASSGVATADTFDDESILGALAKPIAEQRSSHLLDPRVAKLSNSTATSSAASSRVPSPASGSRAALSRHARPASRTGSPPPHIVGQIVEMGFSPAQARKALAQTPSGADVDAALELLVGSAERGTDNDERLARQLQQQEQGRRPADASFHDSDEEDVVQRRRQREHSGRARDPRAAAGNNNPAGRSPAPGSAAAAEWQQQADQLYAQASEIGVSVLSKATAFWSSAKAQAQKALDERNRASGDERSPTPSDAGSERHRNRRWGGASATASARKTEWEGKPKWMVDAEAAEAEPAAPAKAPTAAAESGFKDSDDEDQVPEPATRTARPAKSTAASVSLWDDDDAAAPAPQKPVAQKPPQTVSDKLKATSSTTSAAKPAYISPNRRAAGTKPAAPSASVRRQDPPVASSAIEAANKWKDEGNEHFRRGAYDQAETRYSKGIAALLPDFAASYCATGEGGVVETSVRLLPLLGNRAHTRSKNGDAAGAIADCNASLRIVLAPFGTAEMYRPQREDVGALAGELRESVNLRETYAKALLRRAQAYEATEKWPSAAADWALLERFEKEEGSGARTGTNHLKFAREGVARCERMLGGAPKREAPKRAPPPKRPTAPTSAPLTAAYKATLVKQQAEDTQRFELKDTVDSAIETWKAGKETNLRALLSSLHTILPPELGWQQVGLHQILDPKGLKKSYTRAITKLHPDKLRSATTHHQMLASAAFHTLNEAWNATPSA